LDGLYDIQANLSGPVLVCALAVFGVVIGVLSGLFGVGGGFVIVPLLKVLFGIEYPLAVGSSLCLTIGNGASGMMAHRREKSVEPKTMVILGGCAIIGTLFGASLHHYLVEALSEDNFNLLISGLFIVMLLVTAWLVYRDSSIEKGGKSVLQRLPLPPRVNLRNAGLPDVSFSGLCVVGVLIGLLKGMLGIGGGVLLLPVLIVVVGMNVHQAVGTSLGVVLFSSIAGTIKYGLSGHVSLWIAMSLLVGSSVGIQIGVVLCHKLHAKKLRRYFAVLALVVAAVLAFQFIKDLGWFGS